LSKVEFLVDENILGLDRHLETLEIIFRKVGDPKCPPLGSSDPEVAKFAKREELVVVTSDDNLKKQCELIDVDCVFMDLRDFAKKVRTYADSHA